MTLDPATPTPTLDPATPTPTLDPTTPTPLTHDLLDVPTIKHGFFTRLGGVSYGNGQLNCGPKSGDDPAHIAENRARVGAWLGGSLQGVAQCHSADVMVLERDQNGVLPRADALVTRVPQLAISVLTADCGPILFADPGARVIGAAHSGWQGTAAQIAKNTVAAMERLGATRANIRAVLGPTIALASYEVGPEFPEKLSATCDDPMSYMRPSVRQDHWLFDLPALIGDQLAQLVGQSAVMPIDTYANHDQFFSYRRATHRQESGYGRQISGICLTP